MPKSWNETADGKHVGESELANKIGIQGDTVKTAAEVQASSGYKQPGYEEAPDELKHMYDILGTGDTGKGISFEGLEESFGQTWTLKWTKTETWLEITGKRFDPE